MHPATRAGLTLGLVFALSAPLFAQTSPPLPVNNAPLRTTADGEPSSPKPARPSKLPAKSAKSPAAELPPRTQRTALAPPNKVTQDFYTAYLSENMELAELLLKQGADINCSNCGGPPLLSSALSFSLFKRGGISDHIAWLLARGADPNKMDSEGTPALYNYIAGVSQWGGGLYALGYASDSQLLAWLRALIQAGANPKQGNRNGATPLHVIAKMIQVIDAGDAKMQQRYLALIDELLGNGVDINAKTWDLGYTPLMAGLASGGFGMGTSACNHEMVSYFLTRGADPAVVGKDGKTAYDLALKQATQGVRNCNATLRVLQGSAPTAKNTLPLPTREPQAVTPTAGGGLGNLAGPWKGVLRLRQPSVMVVPVDGSIEPSGAVQLHVASSGMTTHGMVSGVSGDSITLRLRTRAPQGAHFANGSVETPEFVVHGRLADGVYRGDYTAPTDSGEFILCSESVYPVRSECKPSFMEALGGAIGGVLEALGTSP
ncbi:MAG: hypothetical protein A3F78_03785 [Burkholderiales bacterium RIFCSPLOWO2_12_FULL_61_40]|nr:MAG: hypothetical protein A3F78_03785 [Burkholderiales bacterium RIFCSPLOWO2_12_FULL_61_40]